jgi:aryl-alcohol dehydrogenase-like predicted oxidoreductase
MEYRTLGRTGIRVSTYCLGTMMFGKWGNPDADECIAMTHAALDAGVNFVDTADVYDFGVSEEIVGRALRGQRDNVVLATKCNNPMSDDPNTRGNSRRWITHAVDDSLRRLQTDWIDLYQVHRPDLDTDIDETLGALSDLVHSGKVRAIGTSTFPAELLVEAQWTAERRGRERFATEQPPYSVLARGVEAAVLPTCERYGLGVLVWAPLNGGWLSGKYRGSGAPPAGSRAEREPEHFDFDGPVHDRKLALVERLTKIADAAGMRLIDLAHAFVLSHRAVTSAIIGPRTMEQLRDVLAGAGVRLDTDVLDEIDAIVPPGTNVNPADAGWAPPALSDPWLRRRSN